MSDTETATATTNPVGFFAPVAIETERRKDGSILLRNRLPLQSHPETLIDLLEHWAETRPDAIFLAERVGDEWINCRYWDFWNTTAIRAAQILAAGCTPERPLMILAPNSIEHAALKFGAMRVGVPVASISPSYASLSSDLKRLRNVIAQLTPGLVYVAGIENLDAVVAFIGELSTVVTPDTLEKFEVLEKHERLVTAFSENVNADTIAKLMFTSGSTGLPKAVINTHRMLCSNQAAIATVWPALSGTPPVLLDWLPWSHTFGGNFTLGFALYRGGAYFIDDGKPTPALEGRTAANLRQISPTAYFNVPSGLEALLRYLEKDVTFAQSFFSRLELIFCAAAALPQQARHRLEAIARHTTDRVVPILGGWGSTETSPCSTLVYYQPSAAGDIGLPLPGTELKLVPDGERYELRVTGRNVMTSYWRDTVATQKAFDEEGFYRIGDAGSLVDDQRPEAGIQFGGRIAENFKQPTGTWVNVSSLRLAVIDATRPFVRDVVVAGHDRSDIGILIFPEPAACQTYLGETIDLETSIGKERISDQIRIRLIEYNRTHPGSSTRVHCFLVQEIPPRIDMMEITDKGYINQRAVIHARQDEIEKLFHNNENKTQMSSH